MAKEKNSKSKNRRLSGDARQPAQIAVAMSGGVDSSVAAALLKKSGPAPELTRYGVNFNVVGVFMRLNSFSQASEKRAKSVAKTLNIPFKVIDFRKEFKKRVIDSFLSEFKSGRTPNPCVICNKQIKFGLLMEKAKAMGAEFIATGHYARLHRYAKHCGQIRLRYQLPTTNYQLLKGKNKTKDQSYFLWQLNQNQLKHILFPIGNYTKKQVREMAEKMNLATAKTPESQEICFIQTTLANFLKKNLKIKSGNIMNIDGKILGKHQGLCFYTIGQRKNIEIPQGPWFVIKKDVKNNILIVSNHEKDVFKKKMLLEKVNWISGKKPKFPFHASIKIRYQHPGYPAMIISQNKVVFNKAQRAIAPGQSAVFYKGKEVIGGAIIK